jgi:hypothetical protein
MDPAAINWTLLVIDHLNPSFLDFDRENQVKQHPSFRCRRHSTYILASLDQQAGSYSGTAASGRR